MTPQELKNSILQRAIEGKLVDQRFEEGDTSNTIKKLLNKKRELVEEGRIYKKKPTTPFFEGNYPFDIPETWRWVQLSDVSVIQEGAGIRKYQYKDEGTQLLCVTNILENNIDLEKKQIFVSEEEYTKKYQHLTPMKGDIVTACSGGSWGKVAIYGLDDIVMLNTSTLRMRFFGDLSNNKYLYYVTQSAFFKEQLKRQLVGIQPNFGYAHYSRIEFPLPPLAEQKRIVEKIEELMPLVDEYEKNWQKLEDLNKKFPEDMKKSLLQEAIRGKLVDQKPEEGSGEDLYKLIQEEKEKLIKEGKIKKQKALPEITEEEIPFDIPESWKWVRINDCIDVRDGTHDTPKYVEEGYPLVTSKNLKNGDIDFSNCKFISKEDHLKISERSRVDVNDILFAMIGSIGNPVKVQVSNEFSIKNMALFKSIRNYFNMDYLYWFLYSSQYDMKKIAYGAVQSFVSLKFLREYLLPLPPLGEQKRIVEKLEELLPLCDQLIEK